MYAFWREGMFDKLEMMICMPKGNVKCPKGTGLEERKGGTGKKEDSGAYKKNHRAKNICKV